MKRRILVAWSSGKDSAWMLTRLAQDPRLEIAGLLTTVSGDEDHVVMHEVPQALVAAQARAAELPLWTVALPRPCPNAEYEARMAAALERARARGVTAVAFGDLYLEDIRDYRVRQLEGSGIEPLFPLWCSREDTPALAREMIDGGLSAVVTCVDTRQLERGFAGRVFDHAFLDALPAGVDPCGERGEFHTFCTRAPCFAEPLAVRHADTRERDGFLYWVIEEDTGRRP